MPRERDIDLERERMSRDALEEALRGAGANILQGGAVQCPFHDDRSASGSIHCDQAGVWRFRCHAVPCAFSGDVVDVRARTAGKQAADLLRERRAAMKPAPPPPPSSPSGQHGKRVFPDVAALEAATPGAREATYTYTNPATGTVDLVVLRYRRREDGKKAFLQARPVAGGFEMGAPPKPWPLYNRGRLSAAREVVVVEGEKCVHALHEFGIVATTSPCGAGKAGAADWSPLAGKRVVLWPDNDEAGIAHMREVKSILETVPAGSLAWVDPDALQLPPKGDVADFVTMLPDDGELRLGTLNDVLDGAESIGAAEGVRTLLEDTIAGRRQSIDWPWAVLSYETKALLPGTVTLLCGLPDTTKSFFLLEALIHWHQQGIPLAVYELEEDRTYHLYRALAQVSCCGALFDDKWVLANPEKARARHLQYRGFLDSFGRSIWDAPEREVTLEEVVQWVEARAQEGRRIIAVDPVTAAMSDGKPWVEDMRFMLRVKSAVRRSGASLLLVTHPKKGNKGFMLDDVAGGAAYTRFSHTVLYFERHTDPVEIKIAGTDAGQKVNRSIHVKKARNGPGNGHRIGMMFYGEALRFIERGVALPG